MKKSYKIFAIFGIITIIVLISSIIYAYYTSKKTVEDNIIFGYNEIEIVKNCESIQKIEKGKNIKWELSFKNTGNVDCYIRVKPIFSDSRLIDNINIDYNLTDFTYNNSDGYYYYNEIVSPKNTTKPIFTNISIKKDANDIILKDFDIYTLVDSVETAQNKSMQDVWNYFNK